MTDRFFSSRVLTDQLAADLEAAIKSHLEPECPVHFVCCIGYPFKDETGREGVYYIGLQNVLHKRAVDLLEMTLKEARAKAAFESAEVPETRQ